MCLKFTEPSTVVYCRRLFETEETNFSTSKPYEIACKQQKNVFKTQAHTHTYELLKTSGN